MKYFKKVMFSVTLLSGMLYTGMANAAAVKPLADRTMSDYDEPFGLATEFKGDVSYKEAMLELDPKIKVLKRLHNVMHKLHTLHKQARIYRMIFDEHRHIVELLKENTRLNVMALEPFFNNAAVLWGAPQHLGGPGHTKYTPVGENLTQDELDEGKLEQWHYFTKYVHSILEQEIKQLKDETLLGLDMYKNLKDPNYIENPLETGYVEAYDALEQDPGEVEAMKVSDYVEGADELVTVKIIDDTPEDMEQETARGIDTKDDLRTKETGTEISIALTSGGNPKVSLKDVPQQEEVGDAFEELYAEWNIARQILKGLYAGQKTWENAALGVTSKSAFPHWRDQRQQFYMDWIRYFTKIQECYLAGQGGEIPVKYYKNGWPIMPEITDEVFQYYTKISGGSLVRNDAYLNSVYANFKNKFDAKYKSITGSNPPNCQAAFNDNPPRMGAPLPPWREIVFYGYPLIYDKQPKDGIPDIRRLFSGNDEWMRMNDAEKDLWQAWLTNAPHDKGVNPIKEDRYKKTLAEAMYYRLPGTAYHELGYFLDGRERLMKGTVPTYNSKVERWNYGDQYKKYKSGNKNPLPFVGNRITDWFYIVTQEDDLRETRRDARKALLKAQQELYDEILEVTKATNDVFANAGSGVDLHQVLQSSGKNESDYYTVYKTNEGGTKAPYGPGQGICEIEEYDIGFDKDNPSVNVDSDGCYRYWIFNEVAHDVIFKKLVSIKEKMLSENNNGYSIPFAISSFAAKYPVQTADSNHPTHKLIYGYSGLRKSGNYWDIVGYNDWIEIAKKDSDAALYVSGATGFLHNYGNGIVMWPWDKKEYLDQVHGIPDPNSFVKIKDYVAQTIAEDDMVEINFQSNKKSFYEITIPEMTHRGPKTYTKMVVVNGARNAKDIRTGADFKVNGKEISGLDRATSPSNHCDGALYSITPDGSAGCNASQQASFEAMTSNGSDFPFVNTHFVKKTADDFLYRPVDKMTYQGVVVAPPVLINRYSEASVLPLRERLDVLANGDLVTPCNPARRDPAFACKNAGGGSINFDTKSGSGSTIKAITVYGEKGSFNTTVSNRLGVAPNLILADYNARKMALDVANQLWSKWYSYYLRNRAP
jgi:hypothetical protein